MDKEEINALSNKIIGCGIEVHKNLGPGLLESAYAQCLAHELNLNEIKFEKELSIPVDYKGIDVDCSYKADFVVDDEIILELKSVERILPIHQAQLLTYLKITDKKLGLLINFNVELLKDGITRIVNNL